MQRKAAIRQFVHTAEVDDATAIKFLSAANYDLNNALNEYYSRGGGEGALRGRTRKATAKLHTVAASFVSDENKHLIPAEGVVRLCAAIGIEPVDPAILVFCHACQCSKMGEFTVTEFVKGCLAFDVEDLKGLGKVVEVWRDTLQKADQMRPIYRWLYAFALEENVKVLSGEMALEYWKILLPSLNFVYTDRWLEFAEAKLCGKEVRSVPRDVWNMVFDFLKVTTPEIVKTFDVTESVWPTLLDEFVLSIKE